MESNPVTIDAALSKSELLSERLKEELTQQGLSIGSRFHSVQQIRDRYGVSLATAHKVVSGLVRSGYLTSKRGQGYFLHSKPKDEDLHPMFRRVPRISKILLAMVQDTPPTRVLSGLQPACEEAGFRLEVVNILAPNFVEMANEDGVAGVILTPTGERTLLRQVHKPKICIGQWLMPEDNVISYVANAEQASIEVVRYCCGLRHDRIALVVGQDESLRYDLWVSQMIAGMRRGFQTYGLKWDDDLVYDSNVNTSRETASSFLATFRERGITAAFIPLWTTFASVYFECVQSGTRIPQDLSMIAWGQHALSRCINVVPTRFELYIERISRRAAEALIAHAEGRGDLSSQSSETFPVQLLLGGTCAVNPRFA